MKDIELSRFYCAAIIMCSSIEIKLLIILRTTFEYYFSTDSIRSLASADKPKTSIMNATVIVSRSLLECMRDILHSMPMHCKCILQNFILDNNFNIFRSINYY